MCVTYLSIIINQALIVHQWVESDYPIVWLATYKTYGHSRSFIAIDARVDVVSVDDISAAGVAPAKTTATIVATTIKAHNARIHRMQVGVAMDKH